MTDSYMAFCQIRQAKRKLIQAVVQDSLNDIDASDGLVELSLLSQIACGMTAPRLRELSPAMETKIQSMTSERDGLMSAFLSATDSHNRRVILQEIAALSTNIVKDTRNEF